jgi:hypothetical protein
MADGSMTPEERRAIERQAQELIEAGRAVLHAVEASKDTTCRAALKQQS